MKEIKNIEKTLKIGDEFQIEYTPKYNDKGEDQIEQKDIQFELTKEELWKKVFIECFLIKYKIVYQSVCYFTIATELRFLQHSTK